MFSTRFRSSTHTPPGRHISRRLQLEQVTSNLRAPLGASAWLMKMVLRTGLIASAADMMGLPSLRLSSGAFGDRVAYALEFAALVEEIGCPQGRGEPAVGKCREIGEKIKIDLRGFGMDRAQHVEAGAAGEGDIEHHHVGQGRENAADRAFGIARMAEELE